MKKVAWQAMTAWLMLFTCMLTSALAQTASTLKQKPRIESLGHGKYRIGKIILDKTKKKFVVPGSVIRLDPPLEFLAVTKGGYKAYESLLELNTNAYEFNLACILIGLNPKSAVPSRVHFDVRPVSGDGVNIKVSWQQNGKRVTVRGEQLLNMIKTPKKGSTWVYTGSILTRNGTYMAQVDGTLIGFVHDPSSVIEHRIGLGLGDYGAVGANKAVVPPIGTAVKLEISNVRK